MWACVRSSCSSLACCLLASRFAVCSSSFTYNHMTISASEKHPTAPNLTCEMSLNCRRHCWKAALMLVCNHTLSASACPSCCVNTHWLATTRLFTCTLSECVLTQHNGAFPLDAPQCQLLSSMLLDYRTSYTKVLSVL